MSDGGKGSSPRPYSVDQKTFGDNWDRIFKKDKKNESSGVEQESVSLLRPSKGTSKNEEHRVRGKKHQ